MKKVFLSIFFVCLFLNFSNASVNSSLISSANKKISSTQKKMNNVSNKTNEKTQIMNDMLSELQSQNTDNSLTLENCYEKYLQLCSKKYRSTKLTVCKTLKESTCQKVVRTK